MYKIKYTYQFKEKIFWRRIHEDSILNTENPPQILTYFSITDFLLFLKENPVADLFSLENPLLFNYVNNQLLFQIINNKIGICYPNALVFYTGNFKKEYLDYWYWQPTNTLNPKFNCVRTYNIEGSKPALREEKRLFKKLASKKRRNLDRLMIEKEMKEM